MSMALAALGIDLMLPAFGAIRADLGLPVGSPAVTGLVTTYFLGLAMGQVVYGPLADRFGRRPVLFIGYGVYALGALASTLLPTLTGLLVARFVWGLGAAGPRVVTLAIVRDRWQGERMSRAMSFIMAVFILVPIVAPSLGAAISAVASWRWLFALCVAAVAAMTVWAGLRMPETLAPQHRRLLSFGRVLAATREVGTHRQTAGYTVAMTVLYGAFTSYLGSSEAIFDQVFDAGDLFPVLFGVLAAVMGGAMLVNAKVVGRFGPRRFVHGVLLAYLVVAALLLLLSVQTAGRPPLVLFMVGLGLILACHALLLPNFNTIAMDPMGAIAGTASSVTGAVQLAGGALLGALIDRTFDATVLPLSVAFLGMGVLATTIVLWTEGGRLFVPLRPVDGAAPGPTSGPDPVDEVAPARS